MRFKYCLYILVLGLTQQGFSQDSSLAWVFIQPTHNDTALVNPQMGWTFHFYSNIPGNYGSRLEPSNTLDDFPGLSTIYLRLPWSYIEPEEGTLNWSIVDAPAQRWIDKGLKVAFRFTCSESWMRYATPQWVQEAGAKGYNFTFGKGVVENGEHWEPDYNDPVFLAKYENFLAKAEERYDGNPNVAFIDVGSFGVWGEGHTFASTRITYSAETVKRHIDLYAKHFTKTILAANDDFAFQGEETIEYARKKGMTLRDDSILVQPPPNSYFHAGMAQDFWPRLPVILENEHYGSSKERGAWGDGSLLLKAVEEYHASYASIHWWPEVFLEEQRNLIHQINQRLGYRLELREAGWPEKVPVDATLTIQMKWANVGVAPCYPGGHAALTLKDDKQGIVAVLVNPGFNVKSLETGPAGAAPVQTAVWVTGLADNLNPGSYKVFVSVGLLDGTPQIALPLDGDDGHRRYPLGSIEILPKEKK
jgi:hypothetical protein